LTDVVAVNKADGENAARARQTQRAYAAALHLFAAAAPPVLTCSALRGEGIGELWRMVEEKADRGRRPGQVMAWFDELLRERLWQRFHADGEVAARRVELEAALREGRMTAPEAVARLLG
jgi:LAO/AO transport system kinase